jgi:hypothetical protein
MADLRYAHGAKWLPLQMRQPQQHKRLFMIISSRLAIGYTLSRQCQRACACLRGLQATRRGMLNP